jgi:hypothetical protein
MATIAITLLAATVSTAEPARGQGRAPRCHASALKATAGSEPDGTRSVASVTVLLRDVGARACRLTTKPRLGLTRLDGRLIAVRFIVAKNFVLQPERLRADKKSVAAIYFTWQNWCGRRMRSFRVVVHLGRGRGTLRVGLKGPPTGAFVPRCGRGRSVVALRYAFDREP